MGWPLDSQGCQEGVTDRGTEAREAKAHAQNQSQAVAERKLDPGQLGQRETATALSLLRAETLALPTPGTASSGHFCPLVVRPGAPPKPTENVLPAGWGPLPGQEALHPGALDTREGLSSVLGMGSHPTLSLGGTGMVTHLSHEGVRWDETVHSLGMHAKGW